MGKAGGFALAPQELTGRGYGPFLPPGRRPYEPEGEMGRRLGIKKHSSFTIANIESSFHEQSLFIPSRLAGWVLETTNRVCIFSSSILYGGNALFVPE
jgi:hypothetical protein